MVKKCLYWIFNTYGIPYTMTFHSGAMHSIRARSPFKRVGDIVTSIANEYLSEATGGMIRFNLTDLQRYGLEGNLLKYGFNQESVFKIKELEIHGQSQNFILFNFDHELRNDVGSEPFVILESASIYQQFLRNAEDLILKPKLILPCPGLKFDKLFEDKIHQLAKDLELDYSLCYEQVKKRVQTLSDSDLITYDKVYYSEWLLDTTRWIKGYNYLGFDNKVYFETLQLTTYYGVNTKL